MHAEPCPCPLSPQGFGSVTAEHWLGNEYVYQLTSQRQYALRVELTDWEGHQAFSLYDRFQIGSEKQNYRSGILLQSRSRAGEGRGESGA